MSGQPPHRVADHLDVRHRRRHPRPDPLRQLAQPRRLRRRLRPHRPQRGRRGDDRRDVLEARAPAPTPARPAGPWGGEPDALAHHEQPDAGRPAPFVRAAGQQRPAALDRPPPQRLRRVDQQRHPRLPGTASATSATGCSVPTSWLADWRQASAVSGRRAAA